LPIHPTNLSHFTGDQGDTGGVVAFDGLQTPPPRGSQYADLVCSGISWRYGERLPIIRIAQTMRSIPDLSTPHGRMGNQWK
jgi:hypothetical protein